MLVNMCPALCVLRSLSVLTSGNEFFLVLIAAEHQGNALRLHLRAGACTGCDFYRV